jgi:hypothetical protein
MWLQILYKVFYGVKYPESAQLNMFLKAEELCIVRVYEARTS